MQKLAAGNWKMNGTAAALAEVKALIAAHPAPGCEMLLCPPATLIGAMAATGEGIPLNFQDAIRWWRLSAAQGYELAIEGLQIMRRHGFAVDSTDSASAQQQAQPENNQ